MNLSDSDNGFDRSLSLAGHHALPPMTRFDLERTVREKEI